MHLTFSTMDFYFQIQCGITTFTHAKSEFLIMFILSGNDT